MLKILPHNSFDFNEPVVSLIKTSNGKLRGLDKRAFLKRADERFIDILEKDPPKAGDVPILLIALGAGEYFGPNRNGDYFSVAACQKYAQTFVKHARFFRNHINTNKARSYGIVKAAQYNPKAARIELVVYLNGNEVAARRNGGLVADKEIEALESGEDIPVSMSCRVPYDVCSGCGHRSRARDEYCDETICVKYGGLRDNIGRLFEDGHILCAHNPVCDWFDISHVFSPADRIAYVLGELALEKKANNSVVCGAELAEKLGLQTPGWLIKESGTREDKQFLLLQALAKEEFKFQKSAGYNFSLPELPIIGGRTESEKLRTLLSTIKSGCLLSAKQFAELRGYKEKQIVNGLRGAFNRLLKRADVHTLLANNPYALMLEYTVPVDRSLKQKSILDPDVLIKSGSLCRINNNYSKQYSEPAVLDYCLYKLAFALEHSDKAHLVPIMPIVIMAY